MEVYPEVQVRLLADGRPADDIKEAVVTLGDVNDWTHTWTGLPGNREYSVEEVEVPEGYTVKYEGSETEGFIVTNCAPKTLTVVKRWGDKAWKSISYPDATVWLLADGKPYGDPVTLTYDPTLYGREKQSKPHTWTDLPGNVEYTVQEEPMTGWNPVYEDLIDDMTGEWRGISVRNYPDINITLVKEWDVPDLESYPPVQVQMYATERVPWPLPIGMEPPMPKPVGDPVTLSEENGWTHVWKGMPGHMKYDFEEIGAEDYLYSYSLMNDDLLNYVYTIRNQPGPSKSIEVVKEWPSEIPEPPDGQEWDLWADVELYAQFVPGGKPALINVARLSRENNWTYVWKNLEPWIDYFVEERGCTPGFHCVGIDVSNDGSSYIVRNDIDPTRKLQVPEDGGATRQAASDPEVKEEAKEEPTPDPEVKEEAKEEPTPDPDLKDEAKEEPTPDPDLKEEAKEEPTPDPDVKEEAKEEPTPDPNVKEEAKEEPTPDPEVKDEAKEGPTPDPDVKDEAKEGPTPDPDAKDEAKEEPTPDPEVKDEAKEEPTPDPDVKEEPQQEPSQEDTEPAQAEEPVAEEPKEASASPLSRSVDALRKWLKL